MGNPVMWFEIAGKNGEELSEFYRSLFGWEIHPDSTGMHMCDTLTEQGIKGAIFPTTDEMPFTKYVTIYITVDDLEVTTAKIESHGGKIVIPPQKIPDSTSSFAMFLDPSGNCIGLYRQ